MENSHNKKLTGDGNFPIPIFTKNKITNNYSKFKIDLFIKSIKKYNGFETVRIDWKAATVRLKINLLCFLVQREEIFFFRYQNRVSYQIRRKKISVFLFGEPLIKTIFLFGNESDDNCFFNFYLRIFIWEFVLCRVCSLNQILNVLNPRTFWKQPKIDFPFINDPFKNVTLFFSTNVNLN